MSDSKDRAAVESSEGKTSVDVLILMDCTGSMGHWIQAAKTESVSIATDIRKEAPQAKFRLGFVGYRDHKDSVRFEEIALSENVEDVQRRLQPIVATGGGDAPEDVAGGLQKAINAAWAADTRIIIMVADAPAHGRKYCDGGDDYPDGDPTGLDPEAQIKEIARRGIDFYFIKCNTSTDRMVRNFANAYESSRANEEQTFSVLDLQHQAPSTSPTGMPPMPVSMAHTGMAMPIMAPTGMPPSRSMAAPRMLGAPVELSAPRRAEDSPSLAMPMMDMPMMGSAAPVAMSVRADTADGSSFRAEVKKSVLQSLGKRTKA